MRKVPSRRIWSLRVNWMKCRGQEKHVDREGGERLLPWKHRRNERNELFVSVYKNYFSIYKPCQFWRSIWTVRPHGIWTKYHMFTNWLGIQKKKSHYRKGLIMDKFPFLRQRRSLVCGKLNGCKIFIAIRQSQGSYIVKEVFYFFTKVSRKQDRGRILSTKGHVSTGIRFENVDGIEFYHRKVWETEDIFYYLQTAQFPC